jgi:hypothetical protein
MNLDPLHLVTAVDHMTWADLERTSRAVLAGFSLVVEADGTQRHEVSIARTKPDGNAPHLTPGCTCGCPSLRDHWQGILDVAADRDIADAFDGSAAVDPEPRRFRHAVFRAAEDLWHARVAPARPTDEDGNVAALSGPDRADFICDRYAGLPADRAAVLESSRGGGPVSAAAIRSIRSRNGYGMNHGEPRPPEPDLLEKVLVMAGCGSSEREIARTLDIGRKAVHRFITDHRPDDSEAA